MTGRTELREVSTVVGEDPLTPLSARLREHHPELGFELGAPTTPGWASLADVAKPEVMETLLATVPATAAGLRNVAASHIALQLTGRLARPLLAALLLERQVIDPDPVALRVHQNDAGKFDRLALNGARLWTPTPGAGPATSTALLDTRLADVLEALLLPVLTTLRTVGRASLRGLWGLVVDMLAGTSIFVSKTTPLSHQDTWRTAEQVGDRLVERLTVAPPLRPRQHNIRWSGGEHLGLVKGTCCLRYREYGLRAREDVENRAAYCGGCPLVDDATRTRQRLAKLEGTDHH